jgi:prophage antirepressor-like protein
MNEIKIFNHAEFGEIRAVSINNEPWFVGKDVAQVLGYSNPRDALSKHVEAEDKNTVAFRDGTSGNPNQTIINESGLYSLILSSKLPGAKKFKRWVTSEVLPSIRKHGGYIAGQEEMSGEELMAKALQFADRKLKEKDAQIRKLTAEVEQQTQVIADFAPKAQYLDVILSSTGTMATSQIAADYNMSAKQLNKILHEAGIQHNVNGQWILYRDKMGMGYTKSITIPIVRSDGRADTKMHTHWTQKGRLMIHDVLAERGIQAVMDM